MPENFKGGFAYILSGKSGVLYTGVTNNLYIRISQHRQKQIEGFSKQYNVTRLVYYEQFGDIREAIAREKQIKGWLRRKKIALIESTNPTWCDLFDHFCRLRVSTVSSENKSKGNNWTIGKS